MTGLYRGALMCASGKESKRGNHYCDRCPELAGTGAFATVPRCEYPSRTDSVSVWNCAGTANARLGTRVADFPGSPLSSGDGLCGVRPSAASLSKRCFGHYPVFTLIFCSISPELKSAGSAVSFVGHLGRRGGLRDTRLKSVHHHR